MGVQYNGGLIAGLLGSITLATIVAILAIVLHTKMNCPYGFGNEKCMPSSMEADKKLYAHIMSGMFWLSCFILLPAVIGAVTYGAKVMKSR